MNKYLEQYGEAKEKRFFDKEGNIILTNSRGFPVLPTFWLKVEFMVISFLSKLMFR